MKPDGEAELEILEVERRLISRVERLGDNWTQLRRDAARKYSLPLLLGAAAVGALTLGMATRRAKPVKAVSENPSVVAKLVALASLLGTLQRLPIGPALQWMRSRRSASDIN